MTLVTGNQLKAARALADTSQKELAEAAKVNVNTIRNMESCGGDPITSGAVIIRRVQVALEAAGIGFLNHGEPGVILRKSNSAVARQSKAKSRAPLRSIPKKRRSIAGKKQ